ncbi:hypothetical protein HXA35_15500 [Bacillus sp. A301a_S52]|nr:hypothetical protein [Bacillus sp. A301a_S52]UJW58739.1 hypothetical protein HXZ66_15580 [Bacillus sp. A116_S68]
MKIELYIEGEKRLFTVPFVPMLAKRKYLECQIKMKEHGEAPTPEQMLDEEDELIAILVDVVFKNQFTVDQLYEGASKPYIDSKLIEAIHGIKPKEELKEKGDEDEGNING